MHEATTPETDTGTTQRVVGPERLRSAAARQRFIASMQPVVGLSHPNLVRTHAVSRRGDAILIVTEPVNGVTLGSILAADPVLSIAAVPAILAQVALALGHAHAAGVVHGALSASCVLIDLNGDAIVADLGVASALATAGTPAVEDEDAALAYASPEVVRGERPSALSDQYAFGALAYELLAGRRPFDGPATKLRQAHLQRNPDPIDIPHNDFPVEWSQAVMQMLEKEPADRFTSLADAVRAITPGAGIQDQSYRGPLGWLVREQLSGATAPRVSAPVRQPANGPAPFSAVDAPRMASLVKELLDAAPRQASRLPAWNVGSHRRALTAAAVVAVCVLSWYQMAPATRARLWSTLLFERPLEWYSMPAPSATAVVRPEQTVAAPVTPVTPPVADVAPVERVVPPPEPRRPVDRHPRVTTSPTRSPQTAPARTPVAPTRIDLPPAGASPGAAPQGAVPPAAAPPAAASPAAASTATASQASTPLANAPPASTPAPKAPASAESSATAHVVTTADASAAARTVVDQLRRANVYALGASMVASKVDQDFVDWLARRPVDLNVGTPSAPRVAPTSDGGALVSYTVPITWTHASGAHPTRTAVLVVTVRPSPSGATLANWSLAQPFVP